MKVANFPNRRNERLKRALARMKPTDKSYGPTKAKISEGSLLGVKTKKLRSDKRRMF